MSEKQCALKPGLYVTATPIGNLADMTGRAVEIMKNAELILCEDTRHTAKLCAAYGIKTPRTAYHEHNAARVRDGIIKKLQGGAVICLVSDAGTPLISDPGYQLVRAAREAGIAVSPVPGPCAAIAALSAAGAPTDRFYFAGFLPVKAGGREAALLKIANINATLVFYESGKRIAVVLRAMKEAFGDRQGVVARELTKIHEQFRTGALGELAAHFGQNAVKGECVILVFPSAAKPPDEAAVDRFVRNALDTMSVKDAAGEASAALGVSRRDAYQRALIIAREAKENEEQNDAGR